MLGKGVKLVDALVAMAIVLPVCALVGGLLGLYGNRFGLSGGVRAGVIGACAGLAGPLAWAVIRQRMKNRSTPPVQQG